LEAKAVAQGWRSPLILSARGEWHPQPDSSSCHSTSLPYELLPSEDSLAHKRTPSAPVLGKGEKKRTHEELKLRASVSVVAPSLRWPA